MGGIPFGCTQAQLPVVDGSNNDHGNSEDGSRKIVVVVHSKLGAN